MSQNSSNILNPSESSFEAQVLDCKVPTLVDFWAPWCPPCRLLKPELERLAPELAGRANVAFVNVDDHPTLAQAFGVSSVPAVFVVKDRRIVDGWVGYSPRGAIMSRLEPHIGA
ncbi:MAG: thioredoxin fold domain-containing protein [Phycisphaerales bacterium]|nr:thioredoxin fold domain-containing protein [Phycisphaerales bacterium]